MRTSMIARSAALAALAATTATAQRGISPMDVMRLRVVTGVFATADPGTFVVTRSIPRGPKADPGGKHTRIFAIRGDADKRLFGRAPSVSAVAMHPDGRRVTFLWKRTNDKHNEVWAVPIAGGDAKRLTTTPRGVTWYRWRPDGKALAFAARDALPPARRSARESGYRQVIVDEDQVDVSLYHYQLQPRRVQRLTRSCTVNSAVWSPRGDRLAAGIAPDSSVDSRYMFTRLFVIDAQTGARTQLVDNPGKLGSFAWSPNGRQIAYLSAVDRRDPHAGTAYVVDADGGNPVCLTPGFAGMVHQIEWHRGNPEQLFAVVSRGVENATLTIDPAAGVVSNSVWSPGIAFRAFSQGEGVFVGSTAAHPAEAFRVDADGKAARLTDSNKWLAGRRLGKQEVVRYRARDGLEIEGLLNYPIGYREGTRYPLVVVAHGGPESHFSDGWNTSYSRWGQMLAARGWFAFHPNYRASTGRGVAFAKADHGDIMGAEFDDVIDGIDHLVGRGLVNRERVAIGGGSYGGFMAAWAATRHTERFAAAVSFVPVTDMRTKVYLTDIPYEAYLVHQEERWPFERPGIARDRSPLTWAPSCRTPLLLLGGTADTRVHPSQPFMLYRAVKYATDTPVRYVQYAGEPHGNRINTNQYDYCVRALRWFTHYFSPAQKRPRMPPAAVDYGAWLTARERK